MSVLGRACGVHTLPAPCVGQPDPVSRQAVIEEMTIIVPHPLPAEARVGCTVSFMRTR